MRAFLVRDKTPAVVERVQRSFDERDIDFAFSRLAANAGREVDVDGFPANLSFRDSLPAAFGQRLFLCHAQSLQEGHKLRIDAHIANQSAEIIGRIRQDARSLDDCAGHIRLWFAPDARP